MSMLTPLPEEVRANVISFLVPFLQGQGHECPVIATGVASRKHRVWKIAGYHWWNLRAAQFVEDTIVRINARLLLRAFEGWFIRTVGPRVDNFSELLSARSRARGGTCWLAAPHSWWSDIARYGLCAWFSPDVVRYGMRPNRRNHPNGDV